MKISLPIDDAIERIQRSFQKNQNLVLIAAPGAGKTTRVPVALLPLTDKKILMLQPRRIAARASAERIASENHWTLGREVGYRVRFEDVSQADTRLLIVTEALLMRELLKDPHLSEYGVIILDEFHERNLYSDAGLAALRELQQLERPDLKILVMSATMNPKPLIDYLAPAALEEVEGRAFPVEVIYDSQSQVLNTDRSFIERVVQRIIEASQASGPTASLSVASHSVASASSASGMGNPSHILVFLPGLSEILRVQEGLAAKINSLKHKAVFPLHGSLSLSDQHKVLETQSPKIILATNIAETSLTIEGVQTVIDSGLARELQNDQRRLYPWLKTTRISRASAEQRKGRAGRTGPGRCFRLWTKLDEQSMPPFGAPDIQTQELSELLLMILQLGIKDPQNFLWFEKPPQNSLDRALQFLVNLDVIKLEAQLPPNKHHYQLTERGLWIQRLPLSPRLGSLVYEGLQKNKIALAVQVASLLNEKDPWSREDLETWSSSSGDSDLIPRLQTLNQNPPPREFKLAHQLSRQLLRLVAEKPPQEASVSPQKISELLMVPFSDRLARRRRPGEKAALVVGQKGVELSPRSLVRKGEFFFCLTGHANENNGNAIVDLAHPIEKTELLGLIQNEISIKRETRLLEEKQTWMESEQKMFRDLPLEEPVLRPIDVTPENLLAMVQGSFPEWKQSHPPLQQLYQRLEWAQTLWPQEPWPPLSLWEEEVLEMACLGEKSIASIKDKNWEEFFLLALPVSMQKLLTQELPDSLKTPNGRRFPLMYGPFQLVTLELKIQDAFGWNETPTIAQGKIKVRLSLLGPHKRPLQTTDDLDSFWQGTYQELRPQLKARYPKHSWPEDPRKGSS